MSGVPRDPAYGKPPRWDRLYGRHFPKHTDGCSRHVRIIASGLRDKRSPTRALLDKAGYEPDHWASSMEVTVVQLWKARAEIERLKKKLAASTLKDGGRDG